MNNVLIIDDDDAIRETITFVLEESGYTILHASDGVVGLTYLRTHARPLLVILDMRMPKMNGIDVLHIVESEPELRRHRYLFLTAGSIMHNASLIAWLKAMGVHTLMKPFDLDQLIDQVESMERELSTDQVL